MAVVTSVVSTGGVVQTGAPRRLILARRAVAGLAAALGLVAAGERVRLLCRPRVCSPALTPDIGWVVDGRLADLSLDRALRRLPGLLVAFRPAALAWVEAEPELLRQAALLEPRLPQIDVPAAPLAPSPSPPAGCALWFAPGAIATPSDRQACLQVDGHGKRHWQSLATTMVEALRQGRSVHLGGPGDARQARWQARALQRAVGMAGLDEVTVVGATALAAVLAVLRVQAVDLLPTSASEQLPAAGSLTTSLDLCLGRRGLRVLVQRLPLGMLEAA